MQTRALVTYINRIYYPFMVREPELGSANGHMWALWLHSLANSSATSTVTLGSALILPSLEHLPDALAASESSISHSGIALYHKKLEWREEMSLLDDTACLVSHCQD